MTNKFLAACKEELHVRNCGFSNLPPEEFVKSQWQQKTKSKIFLVYRLLLGIFFTVVVIYSMVNHALNWPGQEGKYFIYLTNWGIMLNMVTSVLGAVLVLIWYFHPEYSDRVSENNEMPTLFKLYWALHNTSLILSMIITIIYWSVLFKVADTLDANNVLTHAMNSVFMFIDLWIVAYPLRMFHCWQPVVGGLTFCAFTVVYYFAGGTDMKGNRFIYPVLDWSKPDLAMVMVVGTIVLGFILHTMFFIMYKVRYSLYSKFYSKNPMNATESTANLKACDGGISMVLGKNVSGTFNEGFTINNNVMDKFDKI